MRLKSFDKLALALLSSFAFTASAVADQQTTGEKQAGNMYVGGHGIFINADEKRLFLPDSSQSAIDYGSGLGLEVGNRITPWSEIRLSYSHLNIDTEKAGYDVPSGANLAMDYLYFPYQESFYVVTGMNVIDIEGTDVAWGLGGGYRYHLSDRSAIYFEAQGLFEFDHGYNDGVAKLGFIYSFGDTNTPAPRKKAEPKAVASTAVAAKAVQEKDSDNDGVVDSKDQCPNTPTTDRVDSQGCTQFESVELTKSLSINFDNDKDIIKSKYESEVAELAAFMNKYNHVDVTINGHTSARGDATYNQQLSEKRAQAVVDMLVNKFDIDSSRLSVYGHGENQLLETGNSEAAHAANRRIEAKVSVKVQQAVKR